MCHEAASGQETGVNQGAILVLDRRGNLVATFRGRQFLDGPWDLVVHDRGSTARVFVSDVLDATVTRLDLAIDQEENRVSVVRATRIASGYTRRCDPAAPVVGPTGLAYDAERDPITTRGDAVNPDPNQPGEIVEYSPAGLFLAEFSVDSAPGSAFGLAIEQRGGQVRFAAVDDGTNMLGIWMVP
jgi:hypothetical protein